tara:strand:- start:1052 stop:1747 length:696 start_codon:yes stop_codon:yes gene_type:complete
MPIRTIYKLRAQRPKDILTLAGKHAMVGNLYVDPLRRAVSGISIDSGTHMGYFLPSAKVKPNYASMKPLTLHKAKGYKRPDTGEILMIFKNVNFHYSGFMKMTYDYRKSNCTLRWDSSISSNRFIKKGDLIICHWNGWKYIKNEELPQFKRHCHFQQKYSFTKKAKNKRKPNLNRPPSPLSPRPPSPLSPRSIITIPPPTPNTPIDDIPKDSDAVDLEKLVSVMMEECFNT